MTGAGSGPEDPEILNRLTLPPPAADERPPESSWQRAEDRIGRSSFVAHVSSEEAEAQNGSVTHVARLFSPSRTQKTGPLASTRVM